MINESELGVLVPEVLLPDAKVNMKKWSVVACDQFTSEPDYWYDVQKIVGNMPSALNLVLPEVYLNENDRSDRIAKIKSTMKSYVESGTLAQLPRGIVLVERTIGNKKRRGIMLAIDLDAYNFQPGNKSLIRATEQTVLERIPPRMEVRRGAILETPHAMLLMNDEKDTVIGPLYKKRDSFFKLYGFDMMQNGGYLNGWFIDQESDIQSVLDSLANLKQNNEMLFAVGDGNHSLVTAKAIWEEEKEKLSEEERANNPLKYALVEVVNLYDPALRFEPIHRVLFGVSPSVCISEIMSIFNGRGMKAKFIYSRSTPQVQPNVHVLPFVTKDTMGRIEVTNPDSPLEAGTLQDVLDEYLKTKENVVIDYIHGETAFMELSKQYNTLGFRLPAISKEELFPFVYRYGILPKKCFSMGDPEEKRYYTECRLLVKMEADKPEEIQEQQMPQQVLEAAPEETEQKAAKKEQKAVKKEKQTVEPEEDLTELTDDMLLHLDEDEEMEEPIEENKKSKFSIFKKKPKN